MPANDTNDPASGVTGGLTPIVAGLRRHPPLLYGLGAGILIVALAGAVGGIAAGEIWLFVVAIVVLALAGLAAWVVAGGPSGGRLKVGESADLGDDAEAMTSSGGTGEFAPRIEIGRNLRMSGKSKLGVEKGGAEKPPPTTGED